MNVQHLFVFHYHLEVGGITDVIKQGLKILLQHQDLAISVVSSSAPESLAFTLPSQIEVIQDCELAYSGVDDCGQDPHKLKQHLLRNYQVEGGLWWIHNYHLGKSTSFTEAILQVADDGRQPMLLQIHDFPECGRPENLQLLVAEIGLQRLYPISPHIHYLLINYRDYHCLLKAGVPVAQLSVLPNPIDLRPLPKVDNLQVRGQLREQLGDRFPAYEPDKPLALYPVRAIRRKNILEAMAINLVLDNPWNLLVTLPGVSKNELLYSQLVENLFRQGLTSGAANFGLTLQGSLPFPALCSAADLIISSAVSEGFGYSFFNALCWRKPLLARDLSILTGFKHLFPPETNYFYSGFTITLDDAQREKLQSELKRHPPPEHIHFEQQQALLKSKTLDFAWLPLSLQNDLLWRLRREQTFREEIKQLNAPLIEFAETAVSRRCGSAHLENSLGADNFFQRYQKITAQIGGAEKIQPNCVSELMHEYLNKLVFYHPFLSDK